MVPAEPFIQWASSARAASSPSSKAFCMVLNRSCKRGMKSTTISRNSSSSIGSEDRNGVAGGWRWAATAACISCTSATSVLSTSPAEPLFAAADFAFDKLGRVDLLFNHAGVSVGGLLEQIPSEDWNWMLNVNLTGLGRSISAFVPRMTEQGGGWIVNTSSGLGLFHDMPFGGPYLATKAGIIAYSRALATYTRNRGIGVSVFCPDATATNFMSAGRLTGIPKEILAAGVSADQIQTARQAAEVLIEGLKADRFLISAVPDTSEKLLAMAKADLAPESDAFDEHGQSRVVVSKGGLRVPLDKRDEALALFREFAAITQDHYGCQFYDITISASDPEQLVIFEVWDSKAALDAHAAAPGAMDLIMKLFALGASDFGVQEIR